MAGDLLLASVGGHIRDNNMERLFCPDFKSLTNSGGDSSGASVILCDASGGTVAVSLLTADLFKGNQIVVKDKGSAGTNNITISTQGAEKIDGADTKVISANYGSVHLISDGLNWYSM